MFLVYLKYLNFTDGFDIVFHFWVHAWFCIHNDGHMHHILEEETKADTSLIEGLGEHVPPDFWSAFAFPIFSILCVDFCTCVYFQGLIDYLFDFISIELADKLFI